MKKILTSVIYVLTPDILRRSHEASPPSSRALSSTAWLNGARGVAALSVVNWHFLRLFTDRVQLGFATPEHHNLLELPLLRVLWSAAMVHVFFMIGGYTIALRPMQLMSELSLHHDQSHIAQGSGLDKLFRNLSASAFRRGFRLYLPCMTITGMVAILARTGLYALIHDYVEIKNPWLRGTPDLFVPTEPSINSQFMLWYTENVQMMNVWQLSSFFPRHDPHLWTMRYEMRASLCLYMIFLGIAQCKQHVRLVILIMLTSWTLNNSRWAEGQFMLGACLAHVDVWRGKKGQSHPSGILAEGELGDKSNSLTVEPAATPRISIVSWPRRWIRALRRRGIRVLLLELTWLFFFFASIFLLSAPHKYWEKAPGYRNVAYLSYRILGDYRTTWPWTSAAFLFVATISCRSPSTICKRVFNHAGPLYLGKRSFAIYILHGPILHSGGVMLPIWVWMLMGYQEQPAVGFSWALGLLFGWTIYMTVVIGAADVFSREIEARLIRMTAYVEAQCFQR